MLIGLAGLLGITAYFALENLGVDLASASDAALIVAFYPVVTLVFELVWGTVSFSPIRLAGMILAIGGVWLVVRSGVPDASEHRLLGDLLLLAGGVVWAAYNVIVRRDDSGLSPIVLTYYQTVAGAGGFILISLTEVDRWSAPSGGAWLRVVFLAVFCSVVAFALYNYALRTLVPSVAVNLLNIVPVAGLMWAVVLAGESLGTLQVIGGAVVIVGVTLGFYQGGLGGQEGRGGRGGGCRTRWRRSARLLFPQGSRWGSR
jgi:drug/metabolite transporter (DMT)-like permease